MSQMEQDMRRVARNTTFLAVFTVVFTVLAVIGFAVVMASAGSSTPQSDVVTCSPYAVMGSC